MKLPSVTVKQLLEAGVHLGHKTFRWNPKMSSYIFGSKNSIHIIDLVQTLELANAALNEIHKCISTGGKILFVSTKKQAAETIATLAKDTSQFYVNHRWLGGMLTNWQTISNSIKRLKTLSADLKKENTGFTNMIFIVDTNMEELAVKEAIKLNIPIVAILDTNSDPTGINFPIPGNDDARRAINLYCDLIKQTILDAQKNIVKKDNEDTNVKIKKDEPIVEEKKEKPKKIKTEKKEKIKVVQKISKSILSKVKSLTAKKTK